MTSLRHVLFYLFLFFICMEDITLADWHWAGDVDAGVSNEIHMADDKPLNLMVSETETYLKSGQNLRSLFRN